MLVPLRREGHAVIGSRMPPSMKAFRNCLTKYGKGAPREDGSMLPGSQSWARVPGDVSSRAHIGSEDQGGESLNARDCHRVFNRWQVYIILAPACRQGCSQGWLDCLTRYGKGVPSVELGTILLGSLPGAHVPGDVVSRARKLGCEDRKPEI